LFADIINLPMKADEYGALYSSALDREYGGFIKT
jgi:hypothetical protein